MSKETATAAIEEVLDVINPNLPPNTVAHIRQILEALVSKVTAEVGRPTCACRYDPNDAVACLFHLPMFVAYQNRAVAAEASARGLAVALRVVDAHYSASLDYRPPYVRIVRAALSEWEAAEAGRGRRG